MSKFFVISMSVLALLFALFCLAVGAWCVVGFVRQGDAGNLIMAGAIGIVGLVMVACGIESIVQIRSEA